MYVFLYIIKNEVLSNQNLTNLEMYIFATYVTQNIIEKYVSPKDFKNYDDLVIKNTILSTQSLFQSLIMRELI